MKIKYLKEKNFAGLHAGTSRDEIEIDFTVNNINDIILLLGGNGSGKSSLMSILHPFRETFDNRKSPIIKGKDGYKELHLEHNNNTYIIKHYYGKASHKNKSYIQENGIELNENGNITSFTDILKDKFNLTKEYFTIGKIGSNVEGFIGLSTANRKSYINNFIPNIDEYLEAYDIVNEKYKDYNKDIKMLKNHLASMDEDKLLLDKANFRDNIVLINTNMEKVKTFFDVSSSKLEVVKEELKNVPEGIEDIVIKEENELKAIENKILAYNNKYPQLVNYNIEKIKTKLVENETSMTLLNPSIDKAIQELNTLKENKNNKLEEITKNNLLKDKTSEDFIKPATIKVSIFNDTNELKSEEEKFDITKKYLIDNKVDSYVEEEDGYNKCKNEVESLFHSINMIKDTFDYNIVETTDIYNKKNYISELNKLILIQKEEETKLDITKREILSIENSHKKYKEIYNKRPKDCVSSSCPFIIDAVKFMEETYPKLEGLIQMEASSNQILNTLSKDIPVLEDKINYINQIYKYILDEDIIQDKFFIKDMFDFDNFNDVLKETGKYETKLEDILNAMRDYYNSNNNIIRLNNIISNNQILLKTNIQKEEMIQEYENMINNLKSSVEELTINIEESSTKIKELKRQVQIKDNSNRLLEKYKELLEAYYAKEEEYNEYNSIYQNNLDKLNIYNELSSSIKDSEIELKELSLKKNEYDNKLNNVNNELYLFKTYSNKLREIEEQIQDLEYVKDALDPKKGIPLIFMNNYLNVISASTNELLNKAYNGDFKIAFQVTAKEFLIKVFKSDGTSLNDISEASQGEIALTTIALSLAMMENLLKDCEYNILYLDEVDATLSTANRRIFLDLVNVQLEKNIDQCFIISHNGEYYAYPLDLILFKDNNIDQNDTELMANKNIIWQLQ